MGTAETVLAGLADEIMAHFLADRAAVAAQLPAPVPEVLPESLPESLPEVAVEPRRTARPRAIAVAVAAGMIPEDLILSYRADRERQRLAA